MILTEKEILTSITPLYQNETVARMALEVSIDDYRAIEAAVVKKLAGVSVEPFGYFCEWRGGDQAMYYGGPGNGVDDDWNKQPDIHKNVTLYTAEAIAAARVQAYENAARLFEPASTQAHKAYADAIRALIGETP